MNFTITCKAHELVELIENICEYCEGTGTIQEGAFDNRTEKKCICKTTNE